MTSSVPRRHLELELQWLPDRFKLADRVKTLLQSRETEKAVALVQLASKRDDEGKCIVAWNHILGHYVGVHQPNRAWELFNDMKKRGQRPDSYTYSIMLNGLAGKRGPRDPPSKTQVERVVSIFNSMFAPNSNVQPTARHANGALKACANAVDLDTMWGLMARLPEDGECAPDAVTYTILLDAIRDGVYGDRKDVPSEKMRSMRIAAVEEGRRVWSDAVKRWRSGHINMDEKLAVAMARLLLLSDRLKDWDDVLSLTEQVYGIDRQIERVDSPGRKNVDHIPAPTSDDDGLVDERLESPVFGNVTDKALASAFDSFSDAGEDVRRQQRKSHMATYKYAVPGRGTLSMLMAACQKMRTPKTARAYWTLLTEGPFSRGFTPGLSNFEDMLQICSINRTSALAAKLFSEDLPKAGELPRSLTVKLAMHACLRNKNSQNTEAHADQILQAMLEMDILDIGALREYLGLAVSTKMSTRMAHALQKLEPVVLRLRARHIDQSIPRGTLNLEPMEGLKIFYRESVGAVDLLLQAHDLTEEQVTRWKARKAESTHDLAMLRTNIENYEAETRALRGPKDARDLQNGANDEDNQGGTRVRYHKALYDAPFSKEYIGHHDAKDGRTVRSKVRRAHEPHA